MSTPGNDPYRRDDYGASHRRDPASGPYDGPGYDRPGYDGPAQRETYVERDRVVTPSQEQLATEPRPNILAGIMLILGGLMGVLAGLIPHGDGELPIAGAIDLFKTGGAEAIVLGAAILLVFICGLGALAAGAQMFAPKWHAGAARTGMTMGILKLIASLAVVIVVGSTVFDGAGLPMWLLLLACIPTIIGALIGFARK